MTVGSTKNVTFDILRDANRNALWEALDAQDGSKIIIWDVDLIKPFCLIANDVELRAHRVTEWFSLQRGSLLPSSPVNHVFYITRPKLQLMELIADSLHVQRKDDSRKLHLLFTPYQSVVCESKLQEVDIRQKFTTIDALPIFFYNWDVDLASMEIPDMLSDYLIYDDKTDAHTLAVGLAQIETCYGRIPNYFYKGNLAQDVYQLLLKERRVKNNNSSEKDARRHDLSLIDSVVILDRLIDPLTPMMTQLTYEGLIDEIFNIKCASAKFPKEKFAPSDGVESGLASSSSQDDYKKVNLKSSEELFEDLRDLNFNSVPSTLSAFIKQISQEQEERHKATSVHEMKEFVKRLPYLIEAKKSAAVHMAIAELIKDVTRSDEFLQRISAEHEILNEVDTDKALPAIEDGLCKGESWTKILRLMCLQSLAADGLPQKLYDQYKREFLQSYGYNMLPLLVKLQKADLLRVKTGSAMTTAKGATSATSRFAFSPIKRTFRLVVEDVKEQNPTDLSYVYSGYAPLTSRLCSYFLKPGWKIIGENLKRLAGATGIEEENQKFGNHIAKTTDEKKIILVVYVGGITLAEMSALRFLSSQQEECRFLVLTTNVITGDGLIESFC